jgi:hypothetical protein
MEGIPFALLRAGSADAIDCTPAEISGSGCAEPAWAAAFRTFVVINPAKNRVFHYKCLEKPQKTCGNTCFPIDKVRRKPQG